MGIKDDRLDGIRHFELFLRSRRSGVFITISDEDGAPVVLVLSYLHPLLGFGVSAEYANVKT